MKGRTLISFSKIVHTYDTGGHPMQTNARNSFTGKVPAMIFREPLPG